MTSYGAHESREADEVKFTETNAESDWNQVYRPEGASAGQASRIPMSSVGQHLAGCARNCCFEVL